MITRRKVEKSAFFTDQSTLSYCHSEMDCNCKMLHMSTLLNGDLISHLPLLVSLHYLGGKHEPQKFGLFSHAAYRKWDFFGLLCLPHLSLIIIFLAENSCCVCDIISLFNLSSTSAITSIIGCEITNAEMTHFQRYWFFVNMPFTNEDKILLKKLLE